MKIAIIGHGNVGRALQRGLEKTGHEVRAAGREPERIREAARSADVIVLAVPFEAIDEVLRTLGGSTHGKVLLDVTNALTSDFQLALGSTTSGAEELQKKAPSAKVVKGFNTVFATHMDSGHVKGQPLSALIASDDPAAKKTVMDLARAIGFDPIDAGPLRNARLIEPMAYLTIQLGLTLGMGTDIGFRLVH